MFTGIIQNLGSVTSYTNGVLEMSTSLDLSECEIGSSICCNGVCLTATAINNKNNQFFFKVNLGEETQQRTNFSQSLFDKSAYVNIEKSLKIGDEISGHFVYGHIDCITKITDIKIFKNSWEFYFKNFENKNRNFIVEKGSIAINGISLTIATEDKNNFSISVIPHTYENTNLKYMKINDYVNIEFDYLARFSMKDKIQ